MPSIDTYRKQAKLLVRWHREGNYSIGEKLRLLDRYRHLTDREALDIEMPLALAQEIVAVEAGFDDWPMLKAGAGGPVRASHADGDSPVLKGVVPILFVRDVSLAANFYHEALGFKVDFLHGKPPFYAAIARDGARLHLRHVGQPNFVELALRERSLILATIEVTDVKALFHDYAEANVEFAQTLVRHAWGGLDFHVKDLDGNVISFVEYRTA